MTELSLIRRRRRKLRRSNVQEAVMILSKVFSPKSININLQSEDKDEVFEELLESIVVVNPGLDRGDALKALHERENKMSTGIIHDIAVPHGNCKSVNGVKGAIGISHDGIAYDALDKSNVHIVIMLLASPDDCEFHLQVLKRLLLVLQQPHFCELLEQQESAADVYDMLMRFEDSVVAGAL